MHITTLGIDVEACVPVARGRCGGRAVLSRRVTRGQLLQTVASLPPCVIGMEACGSAQHWGRAFEQLGHTGKLMPPKYGQPYVKTNKNDGRDAEAICEAVSRPTRRCVSINTVEQADRQAVHRTDTQGRWLCARTHRTGTHVAAVALANKNARGIWALLAQDAESRPPASVQDGLHRFLRGDAPRAASHQEDAHQGVPRGLSVMTPEGHPARSDPGHSVGPHKAVVLMRRTRAYFIKARTHGWSPERPDI